MRRALDESVIECVKTTIRFYKDVFAHSYFIAGDYDELRGPVHARYRGRLAVTTAA
jgi:acetyl/propionyl-CoA carboxylase alpha subunit